MPGRSLVDSLADQLRHRRALLLLDNCEHLIASAAEIAEALLRAAAGLTILATSREALGIAGETAWRVPSLTLPDAQRQPRPDDLLEYEAVRLLVERAGAAGSSFAVTSDNAGIGHGSVPAARRHPAGDRAGGGAVDSPIDRADQRDGSTIASGC